MPGAGALMLRHGGNVVGFVATVIAIERAVAIRGAVAFAAPVFSAACGLTLIAGAPPPFASLLAAMAGTAYTLNMLLLLKRHGTLPLAAMSIGGFCLAVSGIVWWHTGTIGAVIPWWVAFLTLTIAAERLELLRFQRTSTVGILHAAFAALLLILGPVVSLVQPLIGNPLLGAGLVAAAAWLVVRDVPRRTLRTEGLSRFIGFGLAIGYAWLTVAGVLLLIGGLSSGGVLYDATIHAFFIGFVFSAIMAHEPIIAPSVTGLSFAYTPLFYAPLALLQGALAVRVGADIATQAELRRWSGLVQFIAILLFMALSARSVLLARRRGGSAT
ncbi:MAG: hypothetical protein U0360_07985 [Dehalococcoidia bacterium]